MHRQTVEFAVTRNKDNITRIGRTGINQPRTSFKGSSTFWFVVCVLVCWLVCLMDGWLFVWMDGFVYGYMDT